MNTEIILDSINEKNNAQAKRVINFFKSKGFKKIPSEVYPGLITTINSIYKKEHSDKELEKIITDGDGDGGFDALFFSKNTLDVFDIKEGSNLGLRDVQKIKNFINDLLYKQISNFADPDYARIKNHLKRYYLLSSNKTYNIRLYIVRKSFAEFNDSINNIIKEIEELGGIKIFNLNHEEIIKRYIGNNGSEDPWTVNRIINKSDGIITKEKAENEMDFVIMKIPLIRLLELYRDKGDDLFSDNIRVSKKNKSFSLGLQETIENEKENLFIFHNGITITADRITKAKSSHFLIYKPQIVNGAQTIGNIFSKYKDDLKNINLTKATIICKIIVADDSLTDQICEAANTQKAVSVSDLRTNDIFQKKLELYINNKSYGKYKYNRKGKKKSAGVLDINYIKFFQWVYAAILEKPAKSKGAKKSIFENDKRGEYENIKKVLEKNHNKIILLCDIGVLVNNFIKRENDLDDLNKKSFLRHADMHIIAGLYLLKSTQEVDFNKIVLFLEKYYKKQIGIDSSLNENKVFTKREETWKELKKELNK